MIEKCKCDKCLAEGECETIEYACVNEASEEINVKGKIEEINTLRYITGITASVCNKCLMKRKIRFILFALTFAVASIPFFITGEYLEFGFIFIVVAVTVSLLSTASHELEYAARLNYKKWRNGSNEVVLHPKLMKTEVWEEILKNKDNGKFKILP
jgi:hypothetical protein